MKRYFHLLFVLLSFSCHTEKFHRSEATDPVIGHYGRTVFDQNNDLILIGSASYVEFTFTSDSCILFLKNITPGKDDYNYVAIELDNNYTGRLKIDGSKVKSYTIRSTAHNSSHLLRLYKATESHNGAVAVSAVKATGIKAADHPVRKKIEFIGNSITAGMASDTKEIPCGSGKWYDQHNAYWAYGPRLARTIGADFMLSAVSGIGIYRNWNSNGPAMPQVYESAYLEIDSLQRWDFGQFSPDVVSICLGTNDFSDGDGKTARLPFDSAIYIRNYIGFIRTIYKHYPSVQVALLTSPMLSGNKASLLFACLQTVKARIKDLYPANLPIELFQFKPMVPKGCGYHPDLNDHATLAAELEPFFRKLLER
jgi:lysophospholipase L1-like esterase